MLETRQGKGRGGRLAFIRHGSRASKRLCLLFAWSLPHACALPLTHKRAKPHICAVFPTRKCSEPHTCTLFPTHKRPPEKSCWNIALVSLEMPKSAGISPLCVDSGAGIHTQGQNPSRTSRKQLNVWVEARKCVARTVSVRPGRLRVGRRSQVRGRGYAGVRAPGPKSRPPKRVRARPIAAVFPCSPQTIRTRGPAAVVDERGATALRPSLPSSRHLRRRSNVVAGTLIVGCFARCAKSQMRSCGSPAPRQPYSRCRLRTC